MERDRGVLKGMAPEPESSLPVETMGIHSTQMVDQP